MTQVWKVWSTLARVKQRMTLEKDSLTHPQKRMNGQDALKVIGTEEQ